MLRVLSVRVWRAPALERPGVASGSPRSRTGWAIDSRVAG
jgi:hypothetical protein